MRKRLLSGILIAALGCLALAAVAGARDKAPTKVTIKVQSDGFFGYVKSPKVNACANNREVIVYKQKGSDQHPNKDKEVGSDTAQANGDKYMWSTGNSGPPSGSYYAHVRPTSKCQADSSRTVLAAF
jgi:hypothetical protein